MQLSFQFAFKASRLRRAGWACVSSQNFHELVVLHPDMIGSNALKTIVVIISALYCVVLVSNVLSDKVRALFFH
jgi:hypothetical protein